jgi:hypothetical protein
VPSEPLSQRLTATRYDVCNYIHSRDFTGSKQQLLCSALLATRFTAEASGQQHFMFIAAGLLGNAAADSFKARVFLLFAPPVQQTVKQLWKEMAATFRGRGGGR